MGRKKRNEMSGIFDFLKKPKKEPEQRTLYPLPPAPSSGLPIPAEKKLNPFSILKREAQLPAKPKASPGFFSTLKPESRSVIPAPPAPSKAAVVFPAAQEEKGQVRDIFAPVLRPAPAPAPTPATRYVFLRPSAPPEAPPRPYGLPAAAPAAVREWTLPTPAQLAEFFQNHMDLEGIWNLLRVIREMPEFRADQLKFYKKGIPMVVPVDPVVYQEFYTDFANFYGIPWSVISEYLSVPSTRQKAADEALWTNVFSPLNAMVSEVFEFLKPPDLAGFFTVHYRLPRRAGEKKGEKKSWETPDEVEAEAQESEQDRTTREYWLYYIEPLIEPLALPGGGSGA